MYNKRRDRYSTLRINRFKGLNKSDNPRNIDDAEFSSMLNLYLEKDGTVKSRRGYNKICSNISGSTKIRGIYKTEWEGAGEALYAMGDFFLYRINESTWESTPISSIIGGTEHVSFDRYKDKLLFLPPGKPLAWIDSNDNFSTASYPKPKAAIGCSVYISTQEGGSLEANTYYQYNVSYILGENFDDGETIGALPADEWSSWEDPKNPGPSVVLRFPASHPVQQTTDTDKTLVATNQPFSCTMNGFDVTMVNLFRRKVSPTQGSFSYSPETAWELIDQAYIRKIYDGSDWVYQFESNTMSGEDADGESVGVITDITGTYNPSTDETTLYIDFIDNGTVKANPAYMPRDESSEPVVHAKYMTRLNNRVLLANITNTGEESGKKMVRFSYRGYTGFGSEEEPIMELPDFMWPYPMLIFPPSNYFYCEKYNVSDEITAIHAFQDGVFVFTNNKTFMWREGWIDPVKISDNIGCVAAHSICEFEGKLIWLDKNGVYQYDGKKVKNLTFDKMQYYIDNLTSNRLHRVSAAIHNRKYYLAIPIEGKTDSRHVIIYDFDLEEWYLYQYRYYSGSATFYLYVDYLFNYASDGSEKLLFGGHYDVYPFVGQLEVGETDYELSPIQISFRTKNFTLGAPDIKKTIRRAYIDLDNYGGGALFKTYVDQTDTADNTVTLTADEFGFIVNQSIVNSDYIENAPDKSFAISLPQGLEGSSFQIGLSTDIIGPQLCMKSIGIDWLPKRKIVRVIGG